MSHDGNLPGYGNKKAPRYSGGMKEREKDSQISDAQRGRQAAGAAAAALIEPGMVVGLGTGDTAAQFIAALAERQRERLSSLRCVATSLRSADLARSLGLTCLPLDAFDLGPQARDRPIDLTVDGADEIDGALRLIKGAGGALLFEKLVARASKRLVIVADPQKLVSQLGEKRLLPVEVVAFGAGHTLARLRALPGVSAAELRKQQGNKSDQDEPYVTDGGNRIIDVKLDIAAEHGQDAAALHAAMKALPGVIETGFFLSEATQVILGNPDGRVEVRQRS
jgi:ribose 5-phosphate isomerase A